MTALKTQHQATGRAQRSIQTIKTVVGSDKLTQRKPVHVEMRAGSKEISPGKAKARRITEHAYRVITGATELVDISHLTGEEALELIMRNR